MKRKREHKRAEKALPESERMLATLLSNLPGYAYRCRNDRDRTPEFISEGVIGLTGYTVDDYLIKRIITCGDETHSDDRERIWEEVQRSLKKKKPFEMTYRIITKSGQERWVCERGRGIYAVTGELLCLEGFVTDATDHKRAEESLRQNKDNYSSLLQKLPDIIYQINPDGYFTFLNEAVRSLGYEPEELLGNHFSQIIHPDDVGAVSRAIVLPQYQGKVTGEASAPALFDERRTWKNKRREFDVRLVRKIPIQQTDDGSQRYGTVIILGSVVAVGIYDVDVGLKDKQFLGTLGMIRDTTEIRRANNQLAYLAHHDALTNLPNRFLFLDRLAQGLTRAPWHQRLVAVLFLDLDHFKRINDTLGHMLGDLLLCAVGERLVKCVREGDTVARLGGDEFAIVLADLAKSQDISRVAQKMIDVVAEPFVIEGHELFITVSVGMSLYPNDAQSAETLLKYADMAMYRAKQQGRNNYQYFSPTISAQALERMTMEAMLRHALEREEFLLYYQPLVDIAHGRIIGMEALVRWNHPQLGVVPPHQFITVAEEPGLIVSLGEWVLRSACQQCVAWQSAGLAEMRVAVNVSARQLVQKHFIRLVDEILKETCLHPPCLELELTESVMQDAEVAYQLLSQLSARGVHISIDDFGTGYSSLNYLKRYPINTLKVDMAFIRNVTIDPNDAAIVKAIITMAHSMKLTTIAEGVETEEQLALLSSFACDAMQGYLFSRPLPVDEATQLLFEKGHLDRRHL